MIQIRFRCNKNLGCCNKKLNKAKRVGGSCYLYSFRLLLFRNRYSYNRKGRFDVSDHDVDDRNEGEGQTRDFNNVKWNVRLHIFSNARNVKNISLFKRITIRNCSVLFFIYYAHEITIKKITRNSIVIIALQLGLNKFKSF